MKPHHLSVIFCISFILTVFFLQWYQQSKYPVDIWILIGVLGFFGFLGLIVKDARRAGSFIIAGTFGLSIAFYSVARVTHVPSQGTIDWHANGSQVEIQGIIVDEPDIRPLKTKYTIAVLSKDNIPLSGLVLVTDHDQFPEYAYGDHVIVSGKIERPAMFEDFQYDKYLSRYGIYSVIYRANIQNDTNIASSHHTKNKLVRFMFTSLYSLKSRFEYQINRIYPEPHASFLAGLLTGSRRGIPDHLLENFNATGLTHIIAISGYNITIIIAIITTLLFWIPLRARFIPALIAIVLFTIFVGAEPSVVRAAIMGILGLFALQTKRQKSSRLAILWTGVAMLLWNPKYLWFDPGFQLSFLAVIGLIELSPILSLWLRRVPKTCGMREALHMTVAAQIFAVPWIVYLFGRISLVAPIANILVALPVPLAMLFGSVGVMVSFVWFFPGQIIAYIGWGFLELVIIIARTLATIPYGSIHIQSFEIKIIIAYYMILTVLMITIRRHISSSQRIRALRQDLSLQNERLTRAPEPSVEVHD